MLHRSIRYAISRTVPYRKIQVKCIGIEDKSCQFFPPIVGGVNQFFWSTRPKLVA